MNGVTKRRVICFFTSSRPPTSSKRIVEAVSLNMVRAALASSLAWRAAERIPLAAEAKPITLEPRSGEADSFASSISAWMSDDSRTGFSATVAR